MKASTKEPDWSEKNLIMEDLDKEAARRRKEEELSRNWFSRVSKVTT